MGVSTTPLAAKRGMKYMYTEGREDGVQGTTPGQTPYCNLDDWDTSMTMGSPSKLYTGGYPTDFKGSWPIGEGCFETPWVWAHSEFTPQQTMRGKTALYGYLYGLGKGSTPIGTGGAGGGIDGGAAGGASGGGGGITGSGGATGTGGSAARGGATGSGGRTGGGGAVGSGGNPSGGGATASGGAVGTGGATAVGTGGATAVGTGGQDGGPSSGVGGNAGSTGTGSSGSSGCGCHLGRSPDRPAARGLVAFLAMACAAVLRRRRRPRRHVS